MKKLLFLFLFLLVIVGCQSEVPILEHQTEPNIYPIKHTRLVRVTAYNAMAEQTDATPHMCAWGDTIRPYIVAVSRDLEPLGLTRGTELYIENIGVRTVLDRMHFRKKNQVDIFMETYQDAIRFGIQFLEITWFEYEEGVFIMEDQK